MSFVCVCWGGGIRVSMVLFIYKYSQEGGCINYLMMSMPNGGLIILG